MRRSHHSGYRGKFIFNRLCNAKGGRLGGAGPMP
jgi:hypothetical protein